MSTQYSVETQMSANPETWFGIESIIEKESNCACLYISYHDQYIYLWILKAKKGILFRKRHVNDFFVCEGSKREVGEIFDTEKFRRFPLSPNEYCEDRTWFSSKDSHPMFELSQKASSADFRLVEEEEDEPCEPPSRCYKMLIAPVADLMNPKSLLSPIAPCTKFHSQR